MKLDFDIKKQARYIVCDNGDKFEYHPYHFQAFYALDPGYWRNEKGK